MAGLSRGGLNGPRSGPPSGGLWKGASLAHGTIRSAMRSKIFRCAGFSAAGSASGRGPPKTSGRSDITRLLLRGRRGEGAGEEVDLITYQRFEGLAEIEVEMACGVAFDLAPRCGARVSQGL